MDTKTFTNKVQAKNYANHKDKDGSWLYNYDKVEYKGNKTKVIITCKFHGDFQQTPSKHLMGQGCPKCGAISISNKSTKSTEHFITKATEIHNGFYNYDKVIYTGAHSKVEIICKEHGSFEQTPNSHLKGSRCPLCTGKAKLTTESFISKAELKHKKLYSYENVVYKNIKSKVIINCKIHGSFEQTPHIHLRGFGCSKCSNLIKGWSKTNFKDLCLKNNQGLGTLYVLKCFNSTECFYKVGITSNNVATRYQGKREMPYSYETLYEIILDADTIYDLENNLLKRLSNFKYQPIEFFDGHTECFSSIDIIREYLEELI